MKDGDERYVDAKLVYVWVAPDESVGISGGFALAGIEVGSDFLELERARTKKVYGSAPEKEYMTYIVDPQDADKLDRIAENLADGKDDRDQADPPEPGGEDA